MCYDYIYPPFRIKRAQELATTGVGYFAGGSNTSGSPGATSVTSSIFKLSFATELSLVSTITLETTRRQGVGVSSPTSGYAVGGSRYVVVALTSVARLVFATESSNLISAVLLVAQYMGVGITSPTSGYVTGAQVNSTGIRNVIDRLTYSSETISALTAKLDLARSAGGAFTDMKGYFAGGVTFLNGNPTFRTNVSGFTFSSETNQLLTAVLSSARARPVGLQTPTTGYFWGGSVSTGTDYTRIDRFNFSTETIALISSVQPELNRSSHVGVSSIFCGYVGGQLPKIMKLDFETETASFTAAVLPTVNLFYPTAMQSPSVSTA